MKNNWIDVADKLPRQGVAVLVKTIYKDRRKVVIGTKWNEPKYPDTRFHFSYCDVDGTNMLDDSEVVAWQSLPKS